MVRRILSVLAGLITGFVIVIIGDSASHFMFPPPMGIDFTNKYAVKEFMSNLPIAALVIMLCFWLLSSFVGGFVAGKINKAGWKTSSIITGSVLMLAAVLNMIFLPHPIWMMVATILLYIPLAFLGGKLAS